ncbi:hypothetical protein DEIPH_ctg037orf0001 [Deinococcus phoenicis]|uniref:Uncharacterized protein n=1 Tax=Deinococcus phoenicis TaxID=1476583 RepID=A0A016QNT5_9DEIO|nr:hypothetical protein [Deinococcus phoenicis]EYB67522.1 hypothetical protein DEIPH_ctg037orf0001 [Deinococcus phoenicis]
MTPARWRSAALLALGVQVTGLFGLAAYSLWRGRFSEGAWFSGIEALLAGLVLAWWTVLLGRFTTGQPVPPTDGTLRALRFAFPWLTSFRLVLWLLTLLFVLNGSAPEANTVALTALLTVWPVGILAGNAVYGTLARLAPNPADLTGRRRLADWLNLAAALSLGMAVFNVVPIAGFSDPVTRTDQLVYALSGALDVLATLLALRAVQAAPVTGG